MTLNTRSDRRRNQPVERPTRIDPDTDETEQQCSRCKEWWPQDREFYHYSNGNPSPTCKACYEESRKRSRSTKAQVRRATPPKLPPVRKGVIQPANNWQRKRHDMHCSAVMLAVLQLLVDARSQEFLYIHLPGVHKRTLNSLKSRGWIAENPGLDGIRFRITPEGERAHRIFSHPARRTDGICPVCGVRPKRVRPNGAVYGYCRECEAEHKKRQYQLGRQRINPERACSRCHERPLHRMSGGKLSTYCTECRHEMRKAEKRAQHDRDLARIAAGEVLLCRACKTRPRAHTDRYVRDRCNECQREYMIQYNDRRRPASKAAKSRKDGLP
ncbi:MAG: hypothetical protein JNJ61_27165 [Anaerolineae bacterium]|nr:hypothetical protein [Anaerolineae bacterium]